MSILYRFAALLASFRAAPIHSELFKLSDRELDMRGLSRSGLTRSFISGLGAQ